ncbi:MAG: hypothetical protein Q7K03_04635 [Dehalococcoidia bacterium]|nr:hypothetical protein [Dehalococcoidia bacterium]
MAKLGTYSYPDIRFGDAVEIAGRILSKFRGTVTVKGLAWELTMAENSGTLFAKIAALRDFGLVEGRGELRISDLGRRILRPANPEEARQTRIEAFQRVDLLRALYEKFEGEAPDDSTLLIALEEISKAPREEIVRRFSLIQKHLGDVARAMRHLSAPVGAEHSAPSQQIFSNSSPRGEQPSPEPLADSSVLYLIAGGARLNAPLTPEYVDVAIGLLRALKASMEDTVKARVGASPVGASEE